MDLEALKSQAVQGMPLKPIVEEAQAIAAANPAEYPGMRGLRRLINNMVFNATGADGVVGAKPLDCKPAYISEGATDRCFYGTGFEL